jgi:hypothetical protein
MALPAYEKLGAFYLGRALDPNDGKDTPELVMYDSRDLTTHAVCVGMTGSGKTGLCMALLEEAAIDGVPALVIDPKGDLANLLLTFPQLRAEDFQPWVDAGEAARKNLSVADYAKATADTWRKGLGEWDQDGERIQRLRDAAEITVYTPGSRAGRQLSMLRSFAPPEADALADSTALKERIGAAVGGLLGLVGIDADALKSREHIFLANLLEHSWRSGISLDLAGLIQGVQKPPFDKVGVFDLETFYPAKERLPLAMAINNLLAAPGFEAWLEGEAVDLQRLLFTDTGKPRVAIVSIAHLNDAERMFVVTSLLNETVAWMRKQSGTSSLRALVYMDEIFGYFPPTAMPPSKIPLLTLMKQARAFGVGVVLATQNPVDLDYKGLSNAGTWFIGRLQTERDKARVIEGLLSAGGAGLEKESLERLMSNLGNRVFLMRNVHEDAHVLMRTRWALSYLRGPLTLNEIQKLKPTSESSASPATTVPKMSAKAATKPMIPNEVKELYATPSGPASTYVPYLLGTVRAHYLDGPSNIDLWQTRSYRAPLLDDGTGPDWSAAQSNDAAKDAYSATATGGIAYGDVPAALLRAQNYAPWGKQLADLVYQTSTCELLRCPLLKLSSTNGESEGDFRARVAQALREKRDTEVDKLRAKYAPRITSLSDQVRRASERVSREQSQLSQQKVSTAITVGTAILGAFFGRKALSSANLSRAGTAMRSGGKVAQESADVERAGENIKVLQERLADLQAELESEMARLQGELDPAAVAIETTSIKARKSETTTTAMALVWKPV